MLNDEPKYKILETTRDKIEPVKDGVTPNLQRIGRRESEPHSEEVSYIYDVLTNNFPDSRIFWDLHHYFNIDGEEIDLQFDISFFKGLILKEAVSSYNADQFGGRVPDLVINILSKSTWRIDLLEHVEYCEKLRIPYYIVFTPYNVIKKIYNPPFIRIYHLKDEKYEHFDFRSITLFEDKKDKIDKNKIINLGDEIPFRIGLMERIRKHLTKGKLYRLVFFDKEKDILLKAYAEMFIERAEREKERADKLEKLLNKYKQKFGNID